MKNSKPTKRLTCVMMGVLALVATGGCAQAEEFRSVAGSQIQSGLTSIVTGLIDGIFAVIEPDTTETNQ